MKDSKKLLQEVLAGIQLGESAEEIKSMAFILLESMFGLSKTEIMSGKVIPFSGESARALQKALARINNAEPVQYVIGEEYFFSRKFRVNPSVLIPRPETEALIRIVSAYARARSATKSFPALKILDIGTGSGCIPVTLFHEVGAAHIYATDISPGALSVATENASSLQAKISFLKHDILKEDLPFSDLDVIVSNPPYVMEKEKDAMNANVLGFEPHLALFVPDDDPLLFYKEIVRKGAKALKAGGLLAVEINEKFGGAVSDLFQDAGFTKVEIVKDLAGKQRIVKGYNRPAGANS
ncbi:MAG: peptide chain release factor N(5)-glutamine methyltransferase [Chryseosolibacter sp.]